VSTISATLSASQARNNFYTILEEVSGQLKRFTITLRGKAKAIILNPEEVAAWEETMEILSDHKLLKDIARADRELSKGRLISEKEIMKCLKIKEEDLKK